MSLIQEVTEVITTYGMSGVCVVLFCLVIWLIRLLIGVNKETSAAYIKNTEAFTKFCGAIQSLETAIKEDSLETRKLSEKLIEHISKEH